MLQDDIPVSSRLPFQSRFWQLLYQVGESCRRLIVAIDGTGDFAHHNLANALSEVCAVYHQLEIWKESVPETSQYTQVRVACPASIRLICFKSLPDAGLWSTYWSGRIHLVKSLRQAIKNAELNGFSLGPGPDPADLHRDALSIVEDIHDSAPFLMGEVDMHGNLALGPKGKALGPFLLLRCLHGANTLQGISIERRRWILDCLLQIGHRWGIRMALRVRDQWLKQHGDDERLWP